MDFNDTPEEAAFRAEARGWLEANAERPLRPGESKPLPEPRNPAAVQAAQVWQAHKAEAGWACITWPEEYGGRGAGAIENVVWNQEEARFLTPPNAITEMNQFLPAARSGRPLPVASGPVTGGSFLDPAPEPASRSREDFPRDWTDDLREDIDFCVRRVAAHGMEVLVLDQTRSDVGLPVVKVLIPGMRPFWARFAPGRLFDVPVDLGWLDGPTAEAPPQPGPPDDLSVDCTLTRPGIFP